MVQNEKPRSLGAYSKHPGMAQMGFGTNWYGFFGVPKLNLFPTNFNGALWHAVQYAMPFAAQAEPLHSGVRHAFMDFVMSSILRRPALLCGLLLCDEPGVVGIMSKLNRKLEKLYGWRARREESYHRPDAGRRGLK